MGPVISKPVVSFFCLKNRKLQIDVYIRMFVAVRKKVQQFKLVFEFFDGTM